MWQAMAALLPKTASSVTGLRDFTDWKNTFKCGRMSSQSCPLYTVSSCTGSLPSCGSCSACHCFTYSSRIFAGKLKL